MIKYNFIWFFFQYILNDRISYPEETFMDMEFKISVMYDIAKVLFVYVVNLWVCNLFIHFIFIFYVLWKTNSGNKITVLLQ